MKTTLRRFVWVAAAAVAPSIALAQDTTTIRPVTVTGPAVQRIATASAVSTEQLGVITSVRELPDGRVLVNDGSRRRLLLMDTTLRTVEVVLDSLSEVANTYGVRPGALIPFTGDSTLFVDAASLAIVVLDPQGKMARVRSVWRAQDVNLLASGFYGWPGVDAKGRIVYRIPAQAARPLVAPPSGIPYIPPAPDSAFIVGVNLDTRKLDTLGVIRIPKTEMRIRRSVEGMLSIESVMNPLPSQDDWAVLSDSRIAFVRGRDYRIDYLNPDGTWSSSQKLPFEWQRLTDEDKTRMVDSVKAVQLRSSQSQYVANMIRWANMYKRPYPASFTVHQGYVLPPGLPKEWQLPTGVTFPANYVYACPPGTDPPVMMPGMGERMVVTSTTTASTTITTGAATTGAATTGAATTTGGATTGGAAGAPGAAPPGGPPRMPSCMPAPAMLGGGNTPPPPVMRQPVVLPAADLPDYRPPFGNGSVRADLDGNLWVRTLPPKPIPGGLVYDLISPAGELVNRLQLPPGYTLIGFGKGKIVYLSMRDATGIHLARVRLK